MNDARFDSLPESPFSRLRSLLADIQPDSSPIDMTIGEPRHAFVGLVQETLAGNLAGFGKYPPIRGTGELRGAIGGWLRRRYGHGDLLDPERHVLPLSGTREGLFLVAPFISPPPDRAAARPAIILPNPYYPCYAAAALAADADPVYLPATAGTGFLPDLEALDPALLARTSCLYLCSPSNPQGAVADEAYLLRALELARRHDFVLIGDECYSEIYDSAPPPGLLPVAAGTGSFANVLVFNSLSKRSNLPGLRSGFCAGDEALIRRFATFRNVAAPQMPLPLQAVSAAIWADEAHVEENRRLYARKFAIVRELGLEPPAGGFFLWLDIREHGGSEEVTRWLWRETGVRVLPGAYLGAEYNGENPGEGYIRLALVQDEDTTRTALERIGKTLGDTT
jgi:aspartate/methionine/tyrosine aminotransferase